MPYLSILDLLKDIYTSVGVVDFIKNISVKVEGPIFKSRLTITKDVFIDVFFNSITKTISFTLVKDEKRVFGIDRDTIRGWHRHPFGNPGQHISCKETNFPHFLKEVERNLDKIK